MRKKINLFILAIIFLFTSQAVGISVIADGVYSGGNGTADNPYIIATAQDFLSIPSDSESVYLLTSDIILPSTYIPKSFKGTFKGGTSIVNAKTITVSITSQSDNVYGSAYGTGLFSSLHGNAYVANLKVEGMVNGTNLVGGIAGAVFDRAKIENCVNYANITGNGVNVGGICGAVRNKFEVTALTSCHNKGTVTNTASDGSWTGGITGHNLQSILSCSNNGNVTGNTSVGGITGAQYSQSDTAVKKCYNSGRIFGMNYVGGIAGSSRYVSGCIASSYNSGRIIATGLRSDGTFADVSLIYAGGITSGGMPSTQNSGVTIKDCYNAGEVLGGRDVNNIYSYGGCGATAGVESTANAVISNCYALNHTDSFYPTYKKSDAYIKIKTRYQLNKAAMIGDSALPSLDFQFASSGSYPYPQIIGNPHESVHTEPQVTKPFADASAKGLNKSVLLKWENHEDFNHDMIEISSNGKVLNRISGSETEYLIGGLEEDTEYIFSVYPLNDYKKSVDQHTLTCVTNVAGISDYTDIQLPVTNATFDNGIEGFEIINGSYSNITNSDNSLSINDTDNRAYEVESNWIPVASGVSYKLQIDSMQNRTTGYPYVYINYYDATKNKLNDRPSVRITAGSNRFSEFAIDYNKAPENAKFMSVSITTTGAYVGTAKFDNIRLSARTSGYSDRYNDETAVQNVLSALQISFSGNDTYNSVSNNLNLTTLTDNGVYISWTSDNQDVIDNCGMIGENATEGQQVTLTAYIKRGEFFATKNFNLRIGGKIIHTDLYNPGFEIGTDGYSINAVGSPEIIVSDFSYNEENALQIITDANESVALSGHETQVIPGESYSAYAMVYLLRGSVFVTTEFFDGGYNKISDETRAYNGNLSQWTTLGVVSEAPLNAVYGQVKIEFSQETECFIDDLTLTKTFTDLGMPIQIDYVQSAAIGKNENGEDVIYTVITNETPGGAAKFAIVDITTKNIIKTINMDGVAGSNAIVVDTDNNVYIGTYESGKLFKYIPGNDSLIDMGAPVSGQTHIMSLNVDSNGNIYGGTYPGCYVFSLRKNQTDYEIISPLGANQPFDTTEQYAKSIAYDEQNNVLYVGTATHAKLYRFNLNTNTVSSILPSEFGSNTHIYNLKYENGKLFAYVYPEGKLLVMSFDSNGQPVLETILTGSGSVSKAVNNVSYYINADRKVAAYNYITGAVTTLNSQRINAITCLVDVIDMKDDTNYPGLTFVAFANGIQKDNRLATYNFSKNKLSISEVDLPTIDYSARSVMTGPEGSIYTSNHLGGGLGVYNPVNNTKGLFIGLPQAESGIALNGKMYFGTYTMGKIYEYNPEEPWQMDSSLEINPRRIDNLGTVYEQDRPFAAASGDDMVFFGTAPQYGKLGGVLAIYNPNNLSDKYVVRNLINDQSITALAYKDGYIYGGTSIWGGIGATPTQTECKFFVFDVSGKALVGEYVISSGAQLISSLIVGTDGNIWGLCDGNLFMYDPITCDIEYNSFEFPELNSVGSVTAPKLYGANLVCGKDGYIYGATGSKLFKLNPYSKQIDVVRNGKFISAAVDNFGNIYYSDYSSIWKYSGYDSNYELTSESAPAIATYPSYFDDGTTAVFFSQYLQDNNCDIKEYGMIFSRSDNPEIGSTGAKKLKSDTGTTVKGHFGIALLNHNELIYKDYYIRTYVIYEKQGSLYTVYGNTVLVKQAC